MLMDLPECLTDNFSSMLLSQACGRSRLSVHTHSVSIIYPLDLNLRLRLLARISVGSSPPSPAFSDPRLSVKEETRQ